jgi:hypothetical protein
MNFIERIKRIFLKSDEEYDQDRINELNQKSEEINRTTAYNIAYTITKKSGG